MAGLDLGKQVGPLPLGAWIVVVGGGLGIAWYSRSQGTGDAEPEVVEDVSGVPGVGDGTVGGWTPTVPGSGTTTPTPPTITTNDEWASYIIAEMIARNYEPTLVDSAIRKYLAGMKLSASEFVIVRLALAIKVPPQVLPATEDTQTPTPTTPKPPTSTPGPVTPKPPPAKPKPPAPKPSARYYTVRKGDSLWKISQRYYKTGTKWGTIYNANRKGKRLPNGQLGKISNPSRIYPGWVLHIP